MTRAEVNELLAWMHQEERRKRAEEVLRRLRTNRT
jgi:hypothetical protein